MPKLPTTSTGAIVTRAAARVSAIAELAASDDASSAAAILAANAAAAAAAEASRAAAEPGLLTLREMLEREVSQRREAEAKSALLQAELAAASVARRGSELERDYALRQAELEAQTERLRDEMHSVLEHVKRTTSEAVAEKHATMGVRHTSAPPSLSPRSRRSWRTRA